MAWVAFTASSLPQGKQKRDSRYKFKEKAFKWKKIFEKKKNIW